MTRRRRALIAILALGLAGCGEAPAHRSASEPRSEVATDSLAQPPSAGVQRVETQGHAPDTVRPGSDLATDDGVDPGADRWVPLDVPGSVDGVEVGDPAATGEAGPPAEPE